RALPRLEPRERDPPHPALQRAVRAVLRLLGYRAEEAVPARRVAALHGAAEPSPGVGPDVRLPGVARDRLRELGPSRRGRSRARPFAQACPDGPRANRGHTAKGTGREGPPVGWGLGESPCITEESTAVSDEAILRGIKAGFRPSGLVK